MALIIQDNPKAVMRLPIRGFFLYAYNTPATTRAIYVRVCTLVTCPVAINTKNNVENPNIREPAILIPKGMSISRHKIKKRSILSIIRPIGRWKILKNEDWIFEMIFPGNCVDIIYAGIPPNIEFVHNASSPVASLKSLISLEAPCDVIWSEATSFSPLIWG